ncbi:Anaerobic ribonucleoside-triphosphate reductase activating protein (fragment) [Agrobacterium genomosp. 2 str. CFBP 5494]|uniref:Uncharacterized protein n=2 Tax=Hyphomicrobiales TaxID=356 RepID=A0A256GZM9_9HYPH
MIHFVDVIWARRRGRTALAALRPEAASGLAHSGDDPLAECKALAKLAADRQARRATGVLTE